MPEITTNDCQIAGLKWRLQLLDLTMAGMAHTIDDGCSVGAEEIEIVRCLIVQTLAHLEQLPQK